MLGAYCTLIPTPAVAKRLYDTLNAKKRVRSIDTEWTKLQKTGDVCSQVIFETNDNYHVHSKFVFSIHPIHFKSSVSETFFSNLIVQVLWPPPAALVWEDALKGIHPEYMRRDGARYQRSLHLKSLASFFIFKSYIENLKLMSQNNFLHPPCYGFYRLQQKNENRFEFEIGINLCTDVN